MRLVVAGVGPGVTFSPTFITVNPGICGWPRVAHGIQRLEVLLIRSHPQGRRRPDDFGRIRRFPGNVDDRSAGRGNRFGLSFQDEADLSLHHGVELARVGVHHGGDLRSRRALVYSA